MILTKILRLLRHRWWVIAAVAVLVGAAAMYVTQVRNQRVVPRFSATTDVSLEVDDPTVNRPGVTSATTSLDPAEAEALAIEANQEIIDAGRATIAANPRGTVLIFSALGRTEAEAIDNVTTIRQAWANALIARQLEARSERIAEIVNEAEVIVAQIEALQPPSSAPPDVPPEALTRFELLESIAAGLEPRLTQLEIDKVLTELGTLSVRSIEEYDAEIALLSARLEEIYAELTTLSEQYGLESNRVAGRTELEPEPARGEVVVPEDLETAWRLEALQTQYDALGAEFESLFALGTDVALPEFADIESLDLTPSRTPTALASLAGGILGALLGLAALFAYATWRRTTYTSADLAPVPVFAELPAVPLARAGGHATTPERLTGVKHLRNSLTAYIEDSHRTPVIGLSRVSIDPQQVRQLAVDLGRRMAASDLKVLLIDLDLDEGRQQADPSQYHSMAEFWSDIRSDPESGAEVLHQILAARFESAPGTMCIIVSGAVEEESDDLILTRSFGLFLDVCRQEADVILAVAPEASTSATQSLLQRLDAIVAVCGVGVSSRDDVLNLAAGGRLLGAALLTGSPGRDMRSPALGSASPTAQPPTGDVYDESFAGSAALSELSPNGHTATDDARPQDVELVESPRAVEPS